MKKAVSLFLALFMVLALFPAQRVNAEYHSGDTCPKCGQEDAIKVEACDETQHYYYCTACGYGARRDFGKQVFDWGLGEQGVIEYWLQGDFTDYTQQDALFYVQDKIIELDQMLKQAVDAEDEEEKQRIEHAIVAASFLENLITRFWNDAAYLYPDFTEEHYGGGATCGTAGICDGCEGSYTVSHEWEWVVDTEPTCGKTGLKHERCVNCGDTRNETSIDATGKHTWEWVVDEEATCGKAGVKHQKCKDCDAVRNQNTSIDPTGDHRWDWIVDQEPTCAPGISHEECKYCHQKRNENTEVPATQEHQWTWVIDKEPTCTTAGVKHEKCVNCGAVQNQDTEIEPAHNWVFTEFGWKGNETDGYTGTNAKFKCSGCGLLGFNYVGKALLDVTVTEPTCKDKGYTTYTATVGGDWSLDGQDHTDSKIALYTDPDPAKHNYQTIIDKEPTCAPGIEHEECSVCHQKRNEDTEIPATQEHQWTWVTDEEATCGKEGKKHEKCSVCEAIRSENTVIGKTPHEWGEPVFSFAEDGTAIGVQTCRNDPEHTKTETAEVINEPELTLPVETTDGKYVYTVTVTIDGKDYTGTIVVEIPHAGDEITYSYDGGPATWTEGTGKSVELRFVRSENDDITYSAFTGLNVDGVDVAEKYYALTKGSAVVTLSADFLGTLSAGDHTIRANFTDGSAEAVLTVKVEEPEVPATGVNDPRALYTWLLTLSLVSAAAALDHRKKIRG